jgi:hypothetical protein
MGITDGKARICHSRPAGRSTSSDVSPRSHAAAREAAFRHPDTAGNGEPTAKAFDVGAQQALSVTDLVVQNPNGDRGRLAVKRGDEVILVEALENLRDLDFHFVAPIVLRERDLVVEVNCDQEGKPEQQETCEESVSFVGFIASLQPAATVPPTTAP